MCLGVLSIPSVLFSETNAFYNGDPSVPVEKVEDEKTYHQYKPSGRGFRVRRGVGRSEYQTKGLRTKTNTSSVRSFRSSRLRTGKSAFSQRRESGRKQTLVKTKYIDSKQTDFSFVLPESFQLVSDTLMNDSGSLVLRDGESFVRVNATKKLCEGGGNAVRYCLQTQEADLWKEELAVFKQREKIEGREVLLGEKGYGIQSQPTALWSVFRVDTGLVGKLVFLHPQKQYVWSLTIDTPDISRSMLRNNQIKSELLQSIFSQKKTSKEDLQKQKRRALLKQRLQEKRSRSYKRSATTNFIGDSFYADHETDSKAVSLSLPTKYLEVADDFTFDGGRWRFESGEAFVEIVPTENICDSQTESIRRRCLESVADEKALSIADGFSLLKTQNMQLQLLKGGQHKNDTVRVVIWRKSGMRKSLVVFAHPQTHQVFMMTLQTSEDQNEILVDTRILRRVLSSLRLKEDEE